MAWRGRDSRQDAAARDERIRAAQAVLSDAVGGIRDGADWQRYLEFQSRLHEYSANNCLLLISQQARLL